MRSLPVAYISKNGKIAAVHESSHGNWEFYIVQLGVPADQWPKLTNPYAEWWSECVEMTERLSHEGTRYGF